MADYSISAILKLVDQLSGPCKEMSKALNGVAESLQGVDIASKSANGSTKDMVTSMSDSMSVIEQQRKVDLERYRRSEQEEKDIMKEIAAEDKRVADDQLNISKALTDIRITDRNRELDDINKINEELNKTDEQRAKNIEDNAKREEKAHQEAAKAAIEAAKQAQEAAKQAQESIMRMGESIMDFGQKMHRVGRWLEMRVTLPLVAAGTAAIKFAKDYDEALVDIQVATQSTNKQMDLINKHLLDQGIQLGIVPKDLAVGYNEFIHSFINIPNTMNIFDYVSKVSIATRVSIGNLTNTLRSMTGVTQDYSEKNIKYFTDLFVVTRRLSNVKDIESLGKAYGKSAAFAKEYGIDSKEILAILIEGSKNLGSMAQAGTALGYTIRTATGVSPLFREMLRSKGLIEAISHVDLKKIGFDQKFIEDFKKFSGGGSRTGNFLIGTVESIKEIKKNFKELQNSIDAGKTAWESYSNGIGKNILEWNRLKAAMETIGIIIGEVLLPIVNDLLEQSIIPFLKYLRTMDKDTLKLILKCLLFAAALGPIISGIANVVIALGALLIALGAVAAVIALVTGVGIAASIMFVGMVAAAIIFAGIAYLIFTKWSTLVKWFKEVLVFLKDGFNSFVNWISNKWISFLSIFTMPEWVKWFFSGKFSFPPIVQSSPIKINNWQSGQGMNQKNNTDITLTINDPSSMVTVEDVKQGGNSRVKIHSLGYTGAY